MKKINFIIFIVIFVGISLLVPVLFSAEENNQSRQSEKTKFQIKGPSPELSPEQEKELKDKIKYQVIEKLRRLYDYKPGIITIKFKDRRIPDRMVLKDGKIITADAKLDVLLEEYGFNDFRVIGAKINREKLDLRIYKYAYCYSPVLEKQAKAFLRATHHKIDKLMKDFEVELYQGEDRPYSEILGLNMQRAREYLDDKEISFKLWDKQITFKYKDRIKDPFSLEIIERLKSQPAIENAYIAPKYYPATDYYAENNMWNLNYSPEGSYPYGFFGSIMWFLYGLNDKYDEDIDAKVVWDNPALYDLSDGGISLATGQPVVIAVIDSGIDFDHPEFIGRYWVNDGEDLDHDGIVEAEDFDGIDNDYNGYVDDVSGFNFCDATQVFYTFWTNSSYIFQNGLPSAMAYDDRGHGTTITGILAAADDNDGIKGIAYNSKILPIKVTDAEGYYHVGPDYSDPAVGLGYAIYLKQNQNVNIVVANLSLSGYEYDAAFSDAVIDATTAGITVVKSTGNGNDSGYSAYNIGELQLSGYYCLDRNATDAAIMVGSSNQWGNVSAFSNYGEGIVDVVAPGEYIITARATYSIYPEWLIIDENGLFDLSLEGTSLSAPHVSGLAALIAANDPNLTPVEIQQKIKYTAELLYDYLGNPIGSDKQGYGKINMSGIPAPAAPQFTSTPPTEAYAGLNWEYQAQATGVIDPWFDWPEGYTPPSGMQLDKGIGLITWTPDIENTYGNTYTVRLLAKNLVGEIEQNFNVIVGASTNPNDYLNLGNLVQVGIPYEEENYWPGEESYRYPITINGPFAELPIAEPDSSWGFPPTNSPIVWWGAPHYFIGILVNDQPLWFNGWEFIPGSYPPIISCSYYWPEPGTGYLWQCILSLENPSHLWPPNAMPGYKLACFNPFGPTEHELLFYNPPALAEIYGYDWDLSLVFLCGNAFIGGSAFSPSLPLIVVWFDPIVIDIPDIHWTPQDQFTEITIRAEGTIYYTNNKTGQAEPLRNVKLQLSNIYFSGGQMPIQYVWTDENGYFDFGEVTYVEGYPPTLFIWAQCRDDDNGNPLIATIVKQIPEPILGSEGFYFTESPMNIDLVQGGSFNAEANILMEIRKTHNFLMNNLELSHGLFNPEPDNPEPAPLILRDNIFCKWIGGNGDSSYIRDPDELIIFQGDPNGPLGSDPGWYEIRHNYALSVLQWHFEEKGIYAIGCSGGIQNFTGDLDWENAFLWGFADLVALRTDGESQINIDYLGQSYDIENTDFENHNLFGGISQPTLSEGVCAGIFLDMVDANPDTLTDELNGSMYSPPGPNSHFNYIFQNMINTALTSIALPNHQFNLIDFSWNWNNYQYPEVNKVWGIYLGHGIVLPEIENP